MRTFSLLLVSILSASWLGVGVLAHPVAGEGDGTDSVRITGWDQSAKRGLDGTRITDVGEVGETPDGVRISKREGVDIRNFKRQPWPEEITNLTFDDILIPNEEFCNQTPLPSPYLTWLISAFNATTLEPTDLKPTVYNTTITNHCPPPANHRGPFWRALSQPNVITTHMSTFNLTRSGPWREGGFGVLSIALGTEFDSQVSAEDPYTAVVRLYFTGISRTGATIAAFEKDVYAPPSAWGGYGPWKVDTQAGFDIGLKEFRIRGEYRWKKKDGSEGVKNIPWLWVDQVVIRTVKQDA